MNAPTEMRSPDAHTGTKGPCTHTGTMSRFIVRRDRLRLVIWIVALAAFTWSVALSFTEIYTTEAERQAIAETMKNPAMTVMVGKGYGLADYTIGAMMAHQMLLFTALAAAVMNILLVARHARAGEEEGTMEMLLALPLGRQASLAATLLVYVGVNTLVALVIGGGLYALGVESLDLAGSLLYGAAVGAVGLFFAALTAFFAQLSDNVRGTIGLSFLVLGAAYVLRAVGDLGGGELSAGGLSEGSLSVGSRFGNEALTAMSPLGLATLTKVYVHNEWWPLALLVGTAVVLAALAFFFHRKRDMGAGLLPHKKGRRNASVFLRGPLGLFARLQRTAIASWAIGLCLLGAAYGSVLGDMESFFAKNELIAQMVRSTNGADDVSLTMTFVTMILSVLAMLCTVPVITTVYKLKSEEKKGRLEHMFSRPLSRTRIFGSVILLACFVALITMTLAAIGLGAVGTAVMAEEMSLGTFLQAGIVYLPAMLVMMGVAVLFVGALPKGTNVLWIYLLYSFIVVYMGGMLQLPDWMAKLSPFGHVAQVPVEEMDWVATSVLLLVAAGCTAIGMFGYRRRDVG